MPAIKNLITESKRVLKRFLPKHSNYTKFIILAHARTGSNYLMSGLQQLPCIRLEEEIFASHERKIGENYEKIIEEVFRPVEKGITHVGFKLFYYHVTQQELDSLLTIKGLKVLHLTRGNKLRTIVSLDKARQSNQWIATKEGPSKAVPIACHDLVHRIDEIHAYEKDFSAHFNDHEVLDLSYEQLTEQPETAFQKVSDFLRLPPVNFQKIILRKQGSSSINEDVLNAEEVKKLLRGTPYEVYVKTY